MNTLETLEQRASRAFQHALSKVEEIGEAGVLAVERLVGLAPTPEAPSPAPTDEANVARIAELEGQLADAISELAKSATISIERGQEIESLKGRLADANTMIESLRGSVNALMARQAPPPAIAADPIPAASAEAAPVVQAADPALVQAAVETTVAVAAAIMGVGEQSEAAPESPAT